MNIAQIKFLSWCAAGLLTAGLSFYVFSFLQRMPQKQKLPDENKVRAVLEEVQPLKVQSDAGIDYRDVKRLFLSQCEDCKGSNGTCRHLNWTGKPPKVEVELVKDATPPPKQRVVVKDLVRILMVKVDVGDPKNSNIVIRYKPGAGVQNNVPIQGFLLKEGSQLASPHDDIRVEAIRPDGVEFAFTEQGREHEVVAPEQFNLKSPIVAVSPDGVVMPKSGTSIPKGEHSIYRPPHTTAIGSNRYVLGTEDLAYVNDNYAEELASKVRTSRHQDPRTGKYDGIEIKEVAAGSVAARHGAQEGDVIKSINGQPVTSVQEAITYAKNNADKYSSWEIVVENRGKTRTVVYESPRD